MCHNDLRTLLNGASVIFKKEGPLIHISSANAMIVGDIHGNIKALEFILRMYQEMECEDVIFLGDYVDRGPYSVAVLCRLFELKIRNEQKTVLLKGNHETMEMNSIYGLYEEIQDHDLFLAVNRTFQEMPVAAVLNDTIFCVHGGIPGVVDIEEISKENSFPYLWNDPSELPGINASVRGIRPKCFGPDTFDEFMEHNELSLMIRGHTALENGYEWWFHRRLLSIFSTPNYAGRDGKGAFAVVKDNEVSVFVFGKNKNNRNESYCIM
ncbi:metallophosphoesterase [Methanolobus profundi]|uniref:metallophosphoesterase n=1 Tax=Methanolobus profundi TaxID=487685 RepID=UPI0015A5BF60|nr:metallophosphoesterase [Methanolobus profundi]